MNHNTEGALNGWKMKLEGIPWGSVGLKQGACGFTTVDKELDLGWAPQFPREEAPGDADVG